ncbi:hypothetical protein [Pedobacter aquatilis]|uniref:hypothetical protein n=1 Tax=Pedobacter aquatilis TaxID=351343 RepID=UPI00292DA538|nr:hypothetical protein [Pedobacter aquatilis]
MPTLQNELSKRFDLQAKIKPKLKEIYDLQITDPAKFVSIRRNTSGNRTYYLRHREIDQNIITMQPTCLN